MFHDIYWMTWTLSLKVLNCQSIEFSWLIFAPVTTLYSSDQVYVFGIQHYDGDVDGICQYSSPAS